MSLSAEAEKRKERLLALKKRKRGQTEDIEPPADPSSSTYPSNETVTPPQDAKP